jgi:hypothetical protein
MSATEEFIELTLKLISGGPTDHPYRWTQAAV